MSLERKRDQRDSLRRQGYSEGQIAEIERAETWRSLRNTFLSLVFLGTIGLGFLWFLDTARSGTLQQTDQYQRADSGSNADFEETEDDTGYAEEPLFDRAGGGETPDITLPDGVEGTESVEVSGDEDRQTGFEYERIRRQQDARSASAEQVKQAIIPWDSPKVIDKIGDALKKGETLRWRGEGQRGYVMVSEPRITGGTECRQVSVSLIDGDDQTVSLPREYCHENGGDWSAQ